MAARWLLAPKEPRADHGHVGIGHAGATLTVEATDTTFRVHDGDHLLIEVARTTTKDIARFKVRKPEPPLRTPG
ncbi:hypothetical protein [Micromonospora sp. IBHARD004]|uniref:hypothetical protein n=1 Tax=Micromonospora sp. IBHARD004 TaxID=3457764 RepID=UPI004057E90E